jgi:uncharacterized membrane protein HdeD (DUF308 family)
MSPDTSAPDTSATGAPSLAGEIRQEIKSATGWSVALGILLVVLGIGAIAVPLASSLAVAFWIAWVLLGCGVIELIYAIQTRAEGGILWKILCAAAYLVAGIYLLVNPLNAVAALALMLSIFLVVQGLFEVIMAIQIRPAPNWGWMLFSGALTLLLGGMLWSEWPGNSLWLIGLVVGISLISSGISRIMLSLVVRQAVQQETP